jgi:hypothetical protein
VAKASCKTAVKEVGLLRKLLDKVSILRAARPTANILPKVADSWRNNNARTAVMMKLNLKIGTFVLACPSPRLLRKM